MKKKLQIHVHSALALHTIAVKVSSYDTDLQVNFTHSYSLQTVPVSSWVNQVRIPTVKQWNKDNMCAS